MTLRCVLYLAVLAAALPLRAQVASNRQLYEQQASACLMPVPGEAGAFELSSVGVMGFLEAALISGWLERGKAVYRPDSVRVRRLPRLDYRVEVAHVSYAAASRRQLARTVRLALHYSWTADTGQILRSERCDTSAKDSIARRDVVLVETPAYPETVGVLPRKGWTRRYLEPAVLGAATVVTVYLFFNLRAGRATAGG